MSVQTKTSQIQTENLQSSDFYCFNVKLPTHSGLKTDFHLWLSDTNCSPVILFSLHHCHAQVLVPCIGVSRGVRSWCWAVAKSYWGHFQQSASVGSQVGKRWRVWEMWKGGSNGSWNKNWYHKLKHKRLGVWYEIRIFPFLKSVVWSYYIQVGVWIIIFPWRSLKTQQKRARRKGHYGRAQNE